MKYKANAKYVRQTRRAFAMGIPPNQGLSNTQKAKIHVAKKQLGLKEDEYRAILSRFGVESSKDLTQNQWPAVEAYLKKIGFIERPGKKRSSATERTPKANYLKKITAILAEAGLPDNYADGIAKRQYKKVLAQCDTDQTKTVMQSLIIFQKRRAGQ